MAGFDTTLSTYDAESVEFRGHDLASEVMGELDFGETIFLLLTGDVPSEGEGRTVNAMLASLMVHGMTPHAIASRMTLLSAPESIQGAVASGMLGAGTRYLGAMERCAEQLGRLADEDSDPDSVEELVGEFTRRGDPFPGIGHPLHTPVDPRAERLFAVAKDADVAGEHVDLLLAVRDAFEDETDRELPINITGAIAAVSADLGLPPAAAKGIAIISRTSGLVAEVVEEQRDPMALEMWQLIEENTEYEP